MKQATHAWIALRAVKLLKDEGKSKNLVTLLEKHAKDAAIATWIPDLADARRGGAKIDNHTFKIRPISNDKGKRFVVNREDLLTWLGPERVMSAYIEKHDSLGKKWWNESYKADPKPGQHLANRTMALSTSIVDLLILGDQHIDALIPGQVKFAPNLPPKGRTTLEQAAIHFFMLSHFVADACMPCHCDNRALAAYKNGLHNKLEERWARMVGGTFSSKILLASKLASGQILDAADSVDVGWTSPYPDAVPDIKAKDVWVEIVSLCRASFVLSSIMAPPTEYPYHTKKLVASLSDIFPGKSNLNLVELDQTVLHDAVLNVAIVWKHIWNRACGKKNAAPIKSKTVG